MTTPLPCYREQTNGVHFTRNAHRPDCTDTDCRGCITCAGRHCTARKGCTWHVQPGEQTCGRCIAVVRRELRWIRDLSALMLTQAIADGLTSDALNLAGPAADYQTFSARRRIDKQWIEARLPFGKWEQAQAAFLDDDDEQHPQIVLTRWEAMIREDYGHDDSARRTIGTAADYLDRTLYRIAHDPEQDFALLRRELRKCRQHLESVIHNDTKPERGAPCPTCRDLGHVVRLERRYAHWCEDESCERLHFADDGSDVWQCPKDRDHWWTQRGYADLLDQRRGA